MELFTQIPLPRHFITLTPESRVLTLGSCFSQHVGEHLQKRMGEEKVTVNPFGVLYNPVSIAQAIEVLTDESFDVAGKVFKGQEGVDHSWLHTNRFSATTESECREKIEKGVCAARHALLTADLLCVTFGTVRCYRLAEDDFVVANCHKEPSRCFVEEEYELQKLIERWRITLSALRGYNSKLKVCFTVSPYRYKKYGYHVSQLHKARLLLLADALVKEFPWTAYFPAYEIMLDELRDYRFYNPDMLHPSEQAVDIISSRFADWTFSPELHAIAKENFKRWKQSQHREMVK